MTKNLSKRRSANENGDFFTEMPKCIWTCVLQVQMALRTIQNPVKSTKNEEENMKNPLRNVTETQNEFLE